MSGMADVFSKLERSRVMATVLGQGNRSTEICLLAALRSHGIKGWRRHYRITGKPDFAFPRVKVAVFLDGCFWHGCPKCSRIPASNTAFWSAKFARTAERDAAQTKELKRRGWKVLRFWEHELKGGMKGVVRRLEMTLAKRGGCEYSNGIRRNPTLMASVDKSLKAKQKRAHDKRRISDSIEHTSSPTGSSNNQSQPLAMKKPRILDLFCCAGGAATGYVNAGFEVVGVDIAPQPNFPFDFYQADALTLDPEFLASFDAIHASPPCQSYSDLAKRNGNGHMWPRLIEPVREMLIRTGLPYIIENVEGAPLLNPVILCGTMFPGLRVLRHRLFEANFLLLSLPHGKHPKVHTFDKRKSHYGKTDEWIDFVQVTGGGNCSVAAASAAMGIDWMSKSEMNEAIPPAYTHFLGRQLMRHLETLTTAKQRNYA